MRSINHSRRFRVLLPLISAGLVLAVAGCPPPSGPDQNVHVFVKATQAATQRREQQLAEWQNTAIAAVRFDRADISVIKTEPFGVILSADGHSQTIDLSPHTAALSAPGADAKAILRDQLRKRYSSFDNARLKVLGFAKARPMITARLMTAEQIAAWQTDVPGNAQLVLVPVIGQLAWTAAVEFPNSNSAAPISQDVLAAWNVSADAMRKLAMENLKSQLNPAMLISQPLGADDRAGSLKPGTNAAVVIHPDFLPLVRKTWESTGDLVIMLNSQRDVRFIGKSEQRLATMNYAIWQRALQSNADPLCPTLLSLSDKGFETFAPSPATAPATKPATRPFIVR